jgi:DNA-binding MarR family transcriptional regulator
MPKDHVIPQSPAWVPASVLRYMAHTEEGVPLRELARRDGCHASTVLRQIRKLESMREDPLVDEALSALCAGRDVGQDAGEGAETGTEASGAPRLGAEGADPSAAQMLRQEGLRVLRRLCENGAVLAVAADMDKAVVVRDGGARSAVVRREIVQMMALMDWITATQLGRVSRYSITPVGRAALREMLAEVENTALGFGEAQSSFAAQHSHYVARARQVRFNLVESPLSGLARRRDKEGKHFLTADLVAAGERLREDFELAQTGAPVGQNWARGLDEPCEGSYQPDRDVGRGTEAARQRGAAALKDLGRGLSDIALRCCCYLEGLEAAEKRLGWSARSGKIVLRIALMRLRDFYRANAGGAGDYIG